MENELKFINEQVVEEVTDKVGMCMNNLTLPDAACVLANCVISMAANMAQASAIAGIDCVDFFNMWLEETKKLDYEAMNESIVGFGTGCGDAN